MPSVCPNARRRVRPTVRHLLMGSFCAFVCPSVRPSVGASVFRQSVHLSALSSNPFVRSSTCFSSVQPSVASFARSSIRSSVRSYFSSSPAVHPAVCPSRSSVLPFVISSVRPSVRPSVYLSVHPSFCLSFHKVPQFPIHLPPIIIVFVKSQLPEARPDFRASESR